MADYEVSKLMWMGIVVALAASIFVVAQPNIKSVASDTLANVQKVVDQIQLPGDNNGNSNEKPNPDDPKWVVKANYGDNGYFLMDGDGNAVVYALDDSKPIVLAGAPKQTSGNVDLKNLEYLNNVELNISGSSYNNFFSGDSNLESIKGLDKWDTSKTTIMDGMFKGLTSLKTLDISHFNTSNVTRMGSMFAGTSSLTSLDLSNFNTSKVTYMPDMFSNMSSLKNLNVSSFNTSVCTDISGIFQGTSGLTTLDVSNFNTSNIISFNKVFKGMSSLENLNISNWDASKGSQMANMFSGDSSLVSVTVDNVKSGPAYDQTDMFTDVNSDVASKLKSALVK